MKFALILLFTLSTLIAQEYTVRSACEYIEDLMGDDLLIYHEKPEGIFKYSDQFGDALKKIDSLFPNASLSLYSDTTFRSWLFAEKLKQGVLLGGAFEITDGNGKQTNYQRILSEDMFWEQERLKKRARAGKIVTFTGAGFAGVGAFCYLFASLSSLNSSLTTADDNSDYYMRAGNVCLAAGAISCSIGIPLWVSGKSDVSIEELLIEHNVKKIKERLGLTCE